MGILLVILLLIAATVLVGYVISRLSDSDDPLKFCIGLAAVVGIIATAMLSLILPLVTAGTVVRLEAFYYENAAIYRDAVVQLKAGVPIHTDELGQGALFLESANLKQIEAFAKAVNTERLALVNYNNSLRRTKHWQNSFMFGLLWANVSPDIKPIRVE